MYRALMITCLLVTMSLHCVALLAAEERPNIVWINAEDMSPHLGCYGHPDAATPNIDALARQGVIYRNAFATAPICSPARSCLATGLYATSLGTQHLRCEVEIPDRVIPLAVRLRELGYFCTNTGKSDYNFDPDGIWDEWSNDPAPWRKREKGQPFYSFITIGETHEGRINFIDRYEEATAELPEDVKHDPDKVTIPPFYPDTPKIRELFARMHDLATVFDRKVGELIHLLKEDGELENTFVFVFGDHGNGLPRYKRWLNDSGLRVPLVISIPSNFRSLSPNAPGAETDRRVSFVDFPATAMHLAGTAVPEIMQGEPFLGDTIAEPREFVFGARSRADDMFEVSRSVFDGRYFYVRHFMPHLPYIQDSVIFDDRKDSFRELRRLHEAGELNKHAEKMWAERKPTEELYDLEADPHELNNLALSKEHSAIKSRLAVKLRHWVLAHRDSGFLPEAEYQIRAAQNKVTPFDVVRNPRLFNLQATLDAAWNVGMPSVPTEELVDGLSHPEAGVRYWSAIAFQAREELDDKAVAALTDRLTKKETSPSVRIAAAQCLLQFDTRDSKAISSANASLAESVKDDRPWVALEAARALAILGERTVSLVPTMKEVVNDNRSEPGSRRPYKDFNYASFTGWALETALSACGEHAFVEAIE